jgi:hypothetical protein
VDREIFAVLDAMPQTDQEDYYLAAKGFPVAYEPDDDPAVQEAEAEAAVLRRSKDLTSEEPESDSNSEISDEEFTQDGNDNDDDQPELKAKRKAPRGPYAKVV